MDTSLKRICVSVAWRWRKATSRLSSAKHAWRNWRAVYLGARLRHIFFQAELQQLLQCSNEWLYKTALEYYKCPSAWRYLSSYQSASSETDGFAKTLDVAEGFAAWALIKHQKPRVVVEVGTQYGISARLWKEALKAYVPDHELILSDLEDRRRFIGDDECTFLKGDARQTLPEIFATKSVHLLYNDLYPYSVLRQSVEEVLQQGCTIFAFHDVGRGKRGPFRPESAILPLEEKVAHDRDCANYGHWKRHIIAEIFNQNILHQDTVVEKGIRMQIFDSLFGFGVVLLNA